MVQHVWMVSTGTHAAVSLALRASIVKLTSMNVPQVSALSLRIEYIFDF